MQRKIITVILLLIMALLLFADAFTQPFIGIGTSNKGIPINIGGLSHNVEIKATFIRPYVQKPTVYNFSIGRQINLTPYEKDNYSITPSVGYYVLRWKDFTAYEADITGKTGIVQNEKSGVGYGLELGKDLFLGRFYVSGNYFNSLYVGVGIKAYFRYNQLQKLR